MKVLIVNDHATLVGGAETHIRILARELVRMGDEVHLLVPGPCSGSHAENILSRERTVYTRERKGAISRIGNRRAADDVKKAVEELGIEVVHAHNIFSRISPLFLAGLRKAGIPTVMTLHDYHIVCPKTTFYRRKENMLCAGAVEPSRCELKRCLGLVKYAYETIKRKKWRKYLRDVNYIAPSEYLAELVKRHGIANVDVVHNGIEPHGIDRKKSGNEADGNEADGNGDGPIKMLFCARLYQEKGVVPMLRGFEMYIESRGNGDPDRPEISLSITGRGPLDAMVREHSKRLKGIEYLGFVDRKRLSGLMNSSHYLILPSLWPENCSMAVLEAMTRGVPVLASDLGGTPELVRDGREGFLMKFHGLDDAPNSRDAMAAAEIARTLERACSNRKERKEMSRRTVERVEKVFSARRMAESTKKIYSSLV